MPKNNSGVYVYVFISTCVTVSKLKPVPFHMVSSPVEEAVMTRLPSGNHLATLTGALFLLVPTWTNFVHTASKGLLGKHLVVINYVCRKKNKFTNNQKRFDFKGFLFTLTM